jgi:sterol O-acyltransferase
MIKIAAQNYVEHGNVLGTNEIMKMMTQRDLIVLGLSDGVMCGVTGFGWILQQMVIRGYIDWNREGWIIQNVSNDSDDSQNGTLGADTRHI